MKILKTRSFDHWRYWGRCTCIYLRAHHKSVPTKSCSWNGIDILTDTQHWDPDPRTYWSTFRCLWGRPGPTHRGQTKTLEQVPLKWVCEMPLTVGREDVHMQAKYVLLILSCHWDSHTLIYSPNFSASSLSSERQRTAQVWCAATALWKTITLRGLPERRSL